MSCIFMQIKRIFVFAPVGFKQRPNVNSEMVLLIIWQFIGHGVVVKTFYNVDFSLSIYIDSHYDIAANYFSRNR